MKYPNSRRIIISAVISCAVAAMTASAYSDSMKPAGRVVSKTFQYPLYKNNRLDACLTWGKGCGKQAADAWCRHKGFDKSKRHVEAKDIGNRCPTKVFKTGQVCAKDFCDGFKSITCVKHSCSGKKLSDCCWGKEC